MQLGHDDALIIMDALPQCIAVVDSENCVCYINNAMKCCLAQSSETVLGKHFHDFLSPIFPRLASRLTDFLKSGLQTQNYILSEEPSPLQLTLKLLSLRGSQNHILVSISGLHSLEDFSVETSLNDSRVSRDVLNSLFTFVALLEIDGTVNYVNEAPLKVADLQFEDVYQKKFWDCYWWSYDTDIQERIREAVKNAAEGQAIRLDIIIRTGGNARMPIDFMLAPQFDENNNVVGLVPSGIDITDRKQKEEEISRLERRNSSLLDYSPVCHKVIDLDFKLRYMNRNGFNMLNLPKNDKRYGQSYPFDFFQPEAKELMKTKLQWVKDNGELQTFESRAKTVDGQDVWLFHSLIPVPDENGDMDYITVVSADITQRKQQEKQLLNAQKVSLAGQLSAGICHDLNNVLNIISSNAELIRLKQKTQDVSKYSEKITQGITRAKSVTDRLLKLAKPTEESITNVDLDAVLRGELQFYKEALPKNTIINVSFNSGATVVLDEHTFDDAVMNLIVNAQKALTDDGEIHISTHIESSFDPQSAYIHCEPAEANEYAVLSIKDDGKGIPAYKLDEVFLPFVSERYDSGGSGLGLAVVSAFAVNNKAGLTVNTEEGKGTEFTFWFPVKTLDKPKVANELPDREGAVSGRNIVIIDDERDLLEVFVEMLKMEGANVIDFHNPDEAKNHIQQKADEIDIVISDQSLGHQIKGNDLVKWINNEYPRIRCFIMTGYSADINLEGLNIGIIEKPATLAKIIKQIS